MLKIMKNQNPKTKQKNGLGTKNNSQIRNQQKHVSMFLLNKLKKLNKYYYNSKTQHIQHVCNITIRCIYNMYAV